jgi:hypothetical protein
MLKKWQSRINCCRYWGVIFTFLTTGEKRIKTAIRRKEQKRQRIVNHQDFLKFFFENFRIGTLFSILIVALCE